VKSRPFEGRGKRKAKKVEQAGSPVDARLLAMERLVGSLSDRVTALESTLLAKVSECLEKLNDFLAKAATPPVPTPEQPDTRCRHGYDEIGVREPIRCLLKKDHIRYMAAHFRGLYSPAHWWRFDPADRILNAEGKWTIPNKLDNKGII